MTTALLNLPAGLVPGAPDRTPEHVLIDDMKACERMTCPDCGRHGLTFEPFAHNGRYVSYAACPTCGYAKLLPAPVPPPRARKELPPVVQPAAVPAADAAPADRLLQAYEVAILLSASIRTVWRMTERGELPPPLRINRKLVRWHQSAIFAWLAAQRGRTVPA